MIELVGGVLNQWDTGRTVAYSGEAQKLEFCNKGDSLALAVDVSRVAGIPDRFLQSGRDLFVFAVTVDEDNHEQTVEVKRFTVHNRPKPKNYLPTEAEEALGELKKITQAALEAAAKAEAAANVMTVTVGEAAAADRTSSEIYAHVCAGGDVYLMDYYLYADGWMWSLLHATEDLAVFGGLDGTNLYFARIDVNGDYSEFVAGLTNLAHINDSSTTDGAWSAKKILQMIAQGGTGDINMDGRDIIGVEQLRASAATAGSVAVQNGETGAVLWPESYDGGYASVYFYGVVGDEAVRLRNVAPGVQDRDAVNVGQLSEHTNSIVDKLCPPIEGAAGIVQCRPVEGYPLTVVSKVGPSLDFYTGITLTHCGKNLFDRSRYPFSEHYIHHRTGNQHGSSGYSATLDYIPCAHLRGQTITLNHPGYEKLPGTNAGIAFYTQQNIDSYISGIDKYTGQVPENANFMRFSVPREYADGTRVQIELGDTITDYEPYWEKTYTMDLSETTAGSYCGAEFNWQTGRLTVTHEHMNMASLDWEYSEDNCYFSAALPGAATGTVLCSQLTQVPGRFDDITSGGYGAAEPDCVFDVGDGFIAVIYTGVDNVEDFIAEMADLEAALVYPSAAPEILEIMPQPITAKAGANTIYSSTGDTQVSGRADPVAATEDLEARIAALEAAIANL